MKLINKISKEYSEDRMLGGEYVTDALREAFEAGFIKARYMAAEKVSRMFSDAEIAYSARKEFLDIGEEDVNG